MSMRAALVLFVGFAVLAGLFIYFRPAPAPEGMPAPANRDAATGVRVIEYVVADGERLAGPALVQTLQGEVLLLRVTSDRADELHLHGYDLSTKLAPGETGELKVIARAAGRFELELHERHLPIALIEVRPR